ncbi:hypothetical protein GPJ56_009598 [Histomonas meleagridis]|uniref:uncharacterized protein n=1 Tax=Histomonas meleagridis TaxID=135588 RepID=UPI003559399F|nr:hypothetical protein GPJ56_009598 [Histomonas meleagridis]KAH0799634.1 hypothetical protein GO595_007548 [Histomonas meleagridis]
MQVFFLLISVVLLIVSAILTFIAVVSILKGLNEFTSEPTHISNTIETVANAANSISDNSFNLINYSLVQIDKNLSTLVNILIQASTVSNVASAVSDYLDTYTNYFKSNSPTIEPDYKAVRGYFEKKQSISDLNFIDTSLTVTAPGIKEITRKLTDNAGDLTKISKEAQTTITDNIQSAQNEISKYEKSISSEINGIYDINSTLQGYVSTFVHYIHIAKPYISLVSIVATIFIILFSIIFFIFFFCNNCFSRCIMGRFSLIGILLDIFIVIPGAIFGLLFFVLNDNCQSLDVTLGNIAGNATGIPSNNFTSMLVCEVERPIFEMGLERLFDYQSVLNGLDEVVIQMTDAFDLSTFSHTLQQLRNFSEGNIWSKVFTSNNIIFQHEENTDKLRIKYKDDEETLIQLNNLDKSIDKHDEDLTKTGEKMKVVTNYVNDVIVTIDTTKNKVVGIGNELIDKAKVIVNDGFNSIKCTEFKCIYSPIKNGLCVHFTDGMAYWLMGVIFFVIGGILTPIIGLWRRKSMGKVQVYNENDDYYEDKEFDKFGNNY